MFSRSYNLQEYVPFKLTGSRVVINSCWLIYTGIAIKLCLTYFKWNADMLLGLALLPYICKVKRGGFSPRYLVPALLFAVIAFRFPVKTNLFLALLFAGLLFFENLKGKISPVLFLLPLLISPAFEYISGTFSFPLRIGLSEVAATLLGFMNIKAQASGNIIQLNGAEFSVDQACAGLHMLASSFMIGLFMIAHYQRQTAKQLHLMWILLVLVLTFALNIACNLCRIMLLVIFKIEAGAPMHDITGIICLLVYVVLPLLCLSSFILKRSEKPHHDPRFHNTIRLVPDQLRYPFLHFTLAVLLLSVTFNLKTTDQLADKNQSNISLVGYQKTVLESGVIKFEKPGKLVYVKPSPFYAPEHDPMICWQGSGYVFGKIKKQVIAGRQVYSGILTKAKDKIYAAWWFDNGSLKTINEFEWRWAAAKGGKLFYLVNVNAETEQALWEEVKRLPGIK
ncbi:exosortase N [Mucilaginibacter celer]|uniref:Exosortase N n=1 Tax=Mucilaginibacter celer TaxID=2305508 RepID=A0A494VRV3_9SPHI|nr:exosortase N [Mucilaginibacter celer]AYL98336.1 exosortase N [Mucilaginibacter celer]